MIPDELKQTLFRTRAVMQALSQVSVAPLADEHLEWLATRLYEAGVAAQEAEDAYREAMVKEQALQQRTASMVQGAAEGLATEMQKKGPKGIVKG